MPSDTDLLVTAVDHLQEVQEEHTTILQHLEARPLLDLAGIERRLEEVADAVERVRVTPVPHRRVWWLTPLLLTLTFVLGLGSGWYSVRWAMMHVPGMALPSPQPTVPVPGAVPRKGK